MFELNGIKYSLEEVQQAADASNMSVEDYVSEFKLVETQEDIKAPQQTIEVADSVALESTKKPVDTPEQKQPETEDVGFFEKIGDLFSAGLSNMPKSLHASLTATRAVPIDLIERLDPKLADKYAKSIIDIDQDLQIALVDNETQEEITIENNPERYKELEQLKEKIELEGTFLSMLASGFNKAVGQFSGNVASGAVGVLKGEKTGKEEEAQSEKEEATTGKKEKTTGRRRGPEAARPDQLI